MRRVLLLMCLLAIPSALGHAEPSASDPVAGAALTAAPDRVWVEFTEEFDEVGSWLRVIDAQGDRVDLDDLTVDTDARRMSISVAPLPNGSYGMQWRTFSPSDGHSVSGLVGFAVGDAAPLAASQQTSSVGVGTAARLMLYLATAVALGPIVFQLAVRRGPLRDAPASTARAMLAAAGLALVGTLLLLFATWSATGLAWSTFIQAGSARIALVRALFAAGLLGVTALWQFGPVRPRSSRVTLAVLWLAFIAVGAFQGHAGGSAARFMQTAHAVGAGAWVGALAWYVLHLRRDAPSAIQDLGRFSTFATVAVATLLFTGIVLATRIAGADLLQPSRDAWRIILGLKVVVLLAMLGLAGGVRMALRKQWLQPVHAWRVVATEGALGFIALGLAGAIMSVGPSV